MKPAVLHYISISSCLLLAQYFRSVYVRSPSSQRGCRCKKVFYFSVPPNVTDLHLKNHARSTQTSEKYIWAIADGCLARVHEREKMVRPYGDWLMLYWKSSFRMVYYMFNSDSENIGLIDSPFCILRHWKPQGG